MKTITIPISEYNEVINELERLRGCINKVEEKVMRVSGVKSKKSKKVNKKTVEKMIHDDWNKRLKKLGM